MNPLRSGWEPEDQDSFSAYLGQVLSGWQAVTTATLASIFSGETNGTQVLTSLIQNGQLIEGLGGEDPSGGLTSTQLQANIGKAFFSFAIPSVWTVAGTRAFILDANLPCGIINPEGAFMSVETQESTWGCVNGRLYYLVYPQGPAQTCTKKRDALNVPPPSCKVNFFEKPPGLEALDGTSFAGVNRSDLITGSVNKYLVNNMQNGGPIANASNIGTQSDLASVDIATPGFIRIPACYPNIAEYNWVHQDSTNTSDPAWPCLPIPSSANRLARRHPRELA